MIILNPKLPKDISEITTVNNIQLLFLFWWHRQSKSEKKTYLLNNINPIAVNKVKHSWIILRFTYIKINI